MRKTNQELVIQDSSIWISVFLLCVSTLVTYWLIVQGNQRGLPLVAFFLLFALIFWRREVVIFDAGSQQAQWTRRRLFSLARGSVPFSEITGIGMETTPADHSQTYRLTILTLQGPIPMSDNYSGNLQNHQNVKQEILDFLEIDSGEKSTAHGPVLFATVADEASVRALLGQGRRIDAIQLVRSTQNISLREAKDLVAAIDEKVKAMQ